MGRRRAPELTQEEIDQIVELARRKKSTAEIHRITGRSETKIYQIKKQHGLCKMKDAAKWDWLTQNWHWVIPEKPEPRAVYFRTPYNYRHVTK